MDEETTNQTIQTVSNQVCLLFLFTPIYREIERIFLTNTLVDKRNDRDDRQGRNNRRELNSDLFNDEPLVIPIGARERPNSQRIVAITTEPTTTTSITLVQSENNSITEQHQQQQKPQEEPEVNIRFTGLTTYDEIRDTEVNYDYDSDVD